MGALGVWQAQSQMGQGNSPPEPEQWDIHDEKKIDGQVDREDGGKQEKWDRLHML